MLRGTKVVNIKAVQSLYCNSENLLNKLYMNKVIDNALESAKRRNNTPRGKILKEFNYQKHIAWSELPKDKKLLNRNLEIYRKALDRALQL